MFKYAHASLTPGNKFNEFFLFSDGDISNRQRTTSLCVLQSLHFFGQRTRHMPIKWINNCANDITKAITLLIMVSFAASSFNISFIKMTFMLGAKTFIMLQISLHFAQISDRTYFNQTTKLSHVDIERHFSIKFSFIQKFF